jgi:hypothetical protein
MDRRSFLSCSSCAGAAAGAGVIDQAIASQGGKAKDKAIQDARLGAVLTPGTPWERHFFRHDGLDWRAVAFADLRPGDKVVCVEVGPTLLVECWEVASAPSSFMAGHGLVRVPYVAVDWTASLLPQFWGVPPHTRGIIPHPSPDQREIEP